MEEEGIVRLSVNKIKTIDQAKLIDMLKQREKNKHTLVYYLFRKKFLHNELTAEEQLLSQPPPEEAKKQETLQSTSECLTSSKPDQLKASGKTASTRLRKKTTLASIKQSDMDSETSSRLPSLSKAPSQSPSKQVKSVRLDESSMPAPIEPRTVKAKANVVVDLKGQEFLT